MGFVVRTIDYKDSSLLVYLLTHEYGLIGLIAKGAKQMKSKLRSGTSKFTYGYFYIYKEDNLSILKEVDVIDNYPRLHEDITLIGYLNYVTDLTTQVYKESNETKLLDYLLVTLNKMNQGLDAAILTNILEVKYLPLLGVSLNLDSCVYELDIHKHRNNDCYYHIGFAYEIAAILNKKVTLPELQFKEIKDSIKDHFSVQVETPKCSYYLAKEVKNVKIGPSPLFMQKRLKEAGMRSINNVVDISNYVMLEFGQPLHFFDKDVLGDKILVRNAKENE